MPTWILALAAAAGHAGLQLLTSLVTEAFLKRAIVLALEKAAARTESDIDDKLLAAAKEAWGMSGTEG